MFLRNFRTILCSHIIHNQIQLLRIDAFRVNGINSSAEEQLQVDIKTLKYISQGIHKSIQDQLSLIQNIIIQKAAVQDMDVTMNEKSTNNIMSTWTSREIWKVSPVWNNTLAPHMFDKTHALADEVYNLHRFRELVFQCIDWGTTFIRHRVESIPVQLLPRDSDSNVTHIWTLRGQLQDDITLLQDLKNRIQSTLQFRLDHLYQLIQSNIETNSDLLEVRELIPKMTLSDEDQEVADTFNAMDVHNATGRVSDQPVADSPAQQARARQLAQIAEQAQAAATAFADQLRQSDNDEPTIPEDQECQACMAAYREIVHLPCGHCMYCLDCYNKFIVSFFDHLRHDREVPCPMCRTNIQTYETITRDNLVKLIQEISEGNVTIQHKGNQRFRIPPGPIILNANLPTRNGIPRMRDLILNL